MPCSRPLTTYGPPPSRPSSNNTIAGIDNAINSTTNPTQQAALQAERTQQLVNEQIDLAQHPTVAWAVEPTSRSAAAGNGPPSSGS